MPHSNIVSAHIWHLWNVDLARSVWNDGPWAGRSCLPDLGHKQAIIMPHVRDLRDTKCVYIKYRVISALISLLTSRITERDEQKHENYC